MDIRIYYHDTDSGGVVYYGRYLNFLEESRTEYIENRGVSVQESDKNGFLYAVRQCNVSYKSPARYGDIITCEAHIDKITAAQVFFKQTIHHKETKQVIVKADVILVSLTRDFKPIAIPSEIRQKLRV